MASILVVDDERTITFLLSEILKKDGHTVTQLYDGKLVQAEIQKRRYDLVVSDLHMNEVGGLDVLKTVKDTDDSTEVLILTGHGSITTAVEAMKFGAFEYLTKPIDIEEFRLKVQMALERRAFKQRIERQERKLKAHQEMIKKDLLLAGQVQQSLVPRPITLPHVDVAVRYMPMIGIGGDFADTYYDGEQKVYLTIVDVTGHGITAALLVNRICSEIQKLVREKREPREILHNLNNFIFDAFHGMAMFMTMFSGVVDLAHGRFTYSGSAHPAAILWNEREREFMKLESQNVILGYEKTPTHEVLRQDDIEIGSGDRIIMYTDGIIEAEDSMARQLGIDGLINFFDRHIHRTADEIGASIMNGIQAFSPNPLKDDVYLIISGIK